MATQKNPQDSFNIMSELVLPNDTNTSQNLCIIIRLVNLLVCHTHLMMY